jgi:hypothetical protein
MFRKAGYLLVALVCLLLVVPSLSCGLITYKRPLELRLEKAPCLNEPVKLTCIRQTSGLDSGGHEKITLKFYWVVPKTGRGIVVPAQEVLVDSDFSWEGEITGQPMNFSATIKFPYEGKWSILARSIQRPEDIDTMFLNIDRESGSFGWPRDCRPPSGDCIINERWPVKMDINLSEVPCLDEPAQLMWSLNSIRDITNVSCEIEFYLLQGTDRVRIPPEEMLIDGHLTWEGSLEKNKLIELSATVKFTKTGDWIIIPSYQLPEQTDSCAQQFYLHIDGNEGHWGWTEPHEKLPSPGVLPPPVKLD